MTKPTSLMRGKEQIKKAIKIQLWLLCILIFIVIVIDQFIICNDLVMARSFAVGAILSFSTQYFIAYFVFKNVGYQSRLNIVNNMYLGELVKWMITIIGFILIFKYLKPIQTPMVMFGYVLLQVIHILQMVKTK